MYSSDFQYLKAEEQWLTPRENEVNTCGKCGCFDSDTLYDIEGEALCLECLYSIFIKDKDFLSDFASQNEDLFESYLKSSFKKNRIS